MAARTLQELVSAAASAYWDRAAVTYDSGSVSDSPASLIYRDLVELAAELAHVLRVNCGPHSGVIGLCCADDLFLPVWILGILQSPAAYVPLDPEAPGLLSARVIKMSGLKYCAVKTGLLQTFQATLIKHAAVEVCVVLSKFNLTLIQIKPLPVAQHGRGLEQTVAQTAYGADLSDAAGVEKDTGHQDLAYVLHTSGTTGLPKIVRVPHKCILPNILHLRTLFQMRPDDVVFLASPLTFDPSVVEMFLTLSSGARLLIVPTVMKQIPNSLAQLLFRNHKATVLQITPTLLARFGHRIIRDKVLSPGSSLRVLALGGEACPSPALLRSWKHKDNKTHIYNIYGITEVSCWASCYKIPESLLQSSNGSSSTLPSVPLGTPLMGTVMEIRDEHGAVVTEREGQVFIGGEDRVCLLDDEQTVIAGTMRATGDWVNVRDSQLHYVGRRDRLIKRHGKRVNLDSVQQLIGTLPEVEACVVGLFKGSRLVAFVVPSTSGDQEAASPLSPIRQRERRTPASSAERQEDASSPVAQRQSEMGSAGILKQLSLLLPSYSVPDSVVLIPALLLTHHGKVDMEALMKIYQRQRRLLQSQCKDVTSLKKMLQLLWQEALNLPEDATISEESNFLVSGGDSLKALCLCEDIVTTVGIDSSELLEIILDRTFSDILHHVAGQTLPASLSVGNRRQTDAQPEDLAKKKRRATESYALEEMHKKERVLKVIRRANELTEVNIRRPEKAASSWVGLFGALDISLSWSSDTGRCVDASPVVLVQEGTNQKGRATVFIGSHSHRVQALDLDSGSLLWERVLGGRIEASAAVSHCGTLLVIGCYDGCVYFLCTATGETRWMFETGDAVKSSAAVDPLRGLVMVGSHDGHVYALNPKVRQCVWKHHCGGGAVFSSPCIHPSHRQLYVASLGGHLLCLDPGSGEVLWSLRRDVPFFSSPNCSSGHMLIGSVDGNIYCFSDAGKQLWRFGTKGPIFSSPCVTPDHRMVLCGSHDGILYCLNSADGSLVWTFQTSAKVYSSPFVFDDLVAGGRRTLVGLASTDGTVWVLDSEDGQMLASHSLPGELFSSPVVHEQSLVIGCRNDYVYCLKLTVKQEMGD